MPTNDRQLFFHKTTSLGAFVSPARRREGKMIYFRSDWTIRHLTFDRFPRPEIGGALFISFCSFFLFGFFFLECETFFLCDYVCGKRNTRETEGNRTESTMRRSCKKYLFFADCSREIALKLPAIISHTIFLNDGIPCANFPWYRLTEPTAGDSRVTLSEQSLRPGQSRSEKR